MAERAVADFGSQMKRAREQRGVSLRQIAEATKISVSALGALERNDISRLPGGIFSRAFVRAYAIEVGLDPEQAVREFITQFPHDSVTVGSPHVPQEDHAAIESSRQSAQAALKLLGVSIPVVGAILYFTLFRAPARPMDAAAPTASAAVASPAIDIEPEIAVPPPAAPMESLAPGVPSADIAAGVGGKPLIFELVATGPATLDVSLDGVRHETRTVAQGERLVFQADREMQLTISDAGSLQLTINGQPAVSLGARGEARTVQIGRRNYGSFLASQ